MIQAGHHNNKVNKIASGSHKSHARCTPATHLPFLRRSRQRRYTQHKMVKGSPLAPAQINGAVAPATAAALSCAKLELPARLERPVLQEVNIQNLRKACPELKDTPPSYVREKLQLLAPAYVFIILYTIVLYAHYLSFICIVCLLGSKALRFSLPRPSFLRNYKS